MGGKSGYQEAGNNFDQINGSKGHIINVLAIIPGEQVLISADAEEVIDFIDVYVETGAVQLYFEDATGKKAWVKAGIPGKLFYPGRYGLDVNTITVSFEPVTVDGVAGTGDVMAFSSDSVDQSANVP